MYTGGCFKYEVTWLTASRLRDHLLGSALLYCSKNPTIYSGHLLSFIYQLVQSQVEEGELIAL
jgi:hypothetical protein